MATDLGRIGDHQKVKETAVYPWPCASDPHRTIKIFDDDILSRNSPGSFTKHTGFCCFGILIPESDIVEVKDNPNHLVMV